MKKLITTVLTSLSLIVTAIVSADTLEMKDGQKIKGTIISQNSSTTVFDIGGQQLQFDNNNIENIIFSNASANQPQEAQNLQVNNSTELAAGSKVVVRTTTTIDSRQHKAGQKFTTRLESDLVAGDTIVAQRGSTIYGVISESKQSGRAAGSSSLELTFTDIMVKNQLVPILTTGVKAVTESTTKATAGRTARLAAVGGLANGSKGAKNAAKVGLGVSLLTSGNSINIPSGTLLEFQLAAPLST